MSLIKHICGHAKRCKTGPKGGLGNLGVVLHQKGVHEVVKGVQKCTKCRILSMSETGRFCTCHPSGPIRTQICLKKWSPQRQNVSLIKNCSKRVCEGPRVCHFNGSLWGKTVHVYTKCHQNGGVPKDHVCDRCAKAYQVRKRCPKGLQRGQKGDYFVQSQIMDHRRSFS